MRYRKKPVEIEAIEFKGNSTYDIVEFCGKENVIIEIDEHLYEAGVGAPIIDLKIKTLEGNMNVSVGDYIIKGVKGEFYPCKPDIFKMTYEEV